MLRRKREENRREEEGRGGALALQHTHGLVHQEGASDAGTTN